MATATLVAITILSGCGPSGSKPSGETNLTPAVPPIQKVTIQSVVPYENKDKIASNIRSECKLNSQLAEFIGEYSQSAGINVNKKSNPKSSDEGNVLIVNITDAVSAGNAFIGHRKYTEIKGDLYNSGKKVSSFRASRASGGGMFGGYKGSCSVLGRTVDTLGKDVAAWLQRPVDNARLGNL